MKLGMIKQGGASLLIARADDETAYAVRDLIGAQNQGRLSAGSMMDIIKNAGWVLDAIKDSLSAVQNGARIAPIDLTKADWLPPQPDPRKILGVAFNNVGIRNAIHKDPGVPNFFLKSASSLTGHNTNVIIRENFGNTIPEPELCVIIGKTGKDIPRDDALSHVFGYSIIDDITSHGMKFAMDSVATTRAPELMRPEYLSWRKQRGADDNDLYFVYHTRSKNCDTFGPMGPWITTRDDIPNPNALRLRAYCDGVLFSDDTTARYTFGVEDIIAEASRFFTLEPGDIIACGTAAKGNADFPHAHRSVLLQERECTIEIELEGLGRLRHGVVHE